MWAAARHINYVQHTNFEGGKTAVKAWPYVEKPCTMYTFTSPDIKSDLLSGDEISHYKKLKISLRIT